MPRKAALACAPLLVAAVLGVAACGSDDSELLARSTAEALNSDLDRIRELASESRCAEAARATQQLATRVDGLPNSIDPELREALSTGVQQLQVLANEPDCSGTERRDETVTETQTETQAPPPETEAPPTQTQTPTQEPPPEEPQEGDGSGGTPTPEEETPPGQGGVPPGQQDGG